MGIIKLEDTREINLNEHWFIPFPQRFKAQKRLFCFPYAAGSPNIFRNWKSGLPDYVEIVAINLPGRYDRFMEKSFSDWPTLLDATEDAISPYLDKPFAFFGHSFGARLIFELTKRLQAKNTSLPTQLFISGCRCPHIPCSRPFIHTLSKAEFFELIFKMNGLSSEVVENQRLITILEPALRADMKLSELWEGSEEQKIKVPITVFCGLQDEVDPFERMHEWERYTEEKFSFYTFPGGHFFLHKNEKKLLKIISNMIE